MAADCVNFVDEYNARRVLLALFEKIAHTAGAYADEHFHEIRAGDGEERNVGFAGDRACQQSLAGSRRSDEKHAFGNASAKLLEFLRIFQEIDDFVKLFLGFVNSSDIFEGRFLLLRREQTRTRFSKAQGFVPASLHLLHHENPEEDQKNQRSKIYQECHPIGVLHFLVAVKDAVILENFRYVRYGCVCNRYTLELPSRLAIITLNLSAVWSQVDDDILHFAGLDVSKKCRVIRLVLVRGLSTGGSHFPQDHRQQNHKKPKENCTDCRVHCFTSPSGLPKKTGLNPCFNSNSLLFRCARKAGVCTQRMNRLFKRMLLNKDPCQRSFPCAKFDCGRHTTSPNNLPLAFQNRPESPLAARNAILQEHLLQLLDVPATARSICVTRTPIPQN